MKAASLICAIFSAIMGVLHLIVIIIEFNWPSVIYVMSHIIGTWLMLSIYKGYDE